MPSSHLILRRPLLLLHPIPPSIRVFSNESTLRMRWPKYWSFSFSISPSNEHPGLVSFRRDWLGGSSSKSHSLVSHSCDPMDCSPPGFSVHGISPGKNTGVGCHFLLQGIFPIQESNPCLLHCRQILHRLS